MPSPELGINVQGPRFNGTGMTRIAESSTTTTQSHSPSATFSKLQERKDYVFNNYVVPRPTGERKAPPIPSYAGDSAAIHDDPNLNAAAITMSQHDACGIEAQLPEMTGAAINEAGEDIAMYMDPGDTDLENAIIRNYEYREAWQASAIMANATTKEQAAVAPLQIASLRRIEKARVQEELKLVVAAKVEKAESKAKVAEERRAEAVEIAQSQARTEQQRQRQESNLERKANLEEFQKWGWV